MQIINKINIPQWDSFEEKSDVMQAFNDLMKKSGVTFTDAEDDPLWKIIELLANTSIKV